MDWTSAHGGPVAPIILLLALAACEVGTGGEVFRRVPSSESQIQFDNEIRTDSSVNYLDFYYTYNGGGVGIADFNGDDRPDVFLGGNMVSSRLYLNEGDFRFRDVTTEAGVQDRSWVTGVSVVDINDDGRTDLYLSTVSVDGPSENRLYVNQGTGNDGVPIFAERAAAYGIADTSNSVQAAFLDFDRDGDQDLYLMRSGTTMAMGRGAGRRGRRPDITDRFYEYVGDRGEATKRFREVSEEVGIRTEGYGLGVAVDDLNKDGWPDVYVANDFLTADAVYLNRGGTRFDDVSTRAQNHQSYSSMGVAISDLNGDLRPDIFVLDMLPREHGERKKYLTQNSFESIEREGDRGIAPQFEHNALHLHRGVGPATVPHFSDVSLMAGVAATSWSWAPLAADFNHDGHRDLYVTNGFPKNVLDQDFLNRVTRELTFGTKESQLRKRARLYRERPGIRTTNYVFRGGEGIAFEDVTDRWSVEAKSYSTGAMYADLDSDGDLDLVVQNVDGRPFVYQNKTSETTSRNYVKLSVEDPDGSRALGARVRLHADGTSRYAYVSNVTGYLSSRSTPLHFGLGTASTVDSVVVTWPGGPRRVLRSVEPNQHLTVSPPLESGMEPDPGSAARAPVFVDRTEQLGLTLLHEENPYREFADDPLLPRLYSRTGPGVAVADVDGRNGVDVFVGGAASRPGTLFRQQADGTFRAERVNVGDARYEDTGALLFDADGDGDNDLYVVSGGSEFEVDRLYQDRLYINDGTGDFSRDDTRLPEISASGGCVTAADYDADGDLDLFVCGRYNPESYPGAARNYLLRNDGGRFEAVADRVAPGLSETGMATAALWTDVDADGTVDLMVAGEWGPIRFYQNEGGTLTEVTGRMNVDNCSGLWSSLHGVDYDSDGDTDYVAGNFGVNNGFAPVSATEPLRLLTGDLNDNSTPDYLLADYVQGEEGRFLAPYYGRTDLISKYPALKYSIPDHASYADLSVWEILPRSTLDSARTREAECLRSVLLEKTDSTRFETHPLPWKTQLSPIHGIVSGFVDDDSSPEVVTAGNLFASETLYGWQDAGLGSYLRREADTLRYVPNAESGLFLDGDTRALTRLVTNTSEHILLSAANADSLVAMSSGKDRAERTVLDLRRGDQYADLHFADGTVHRREFYHGGGALSQSHRVLSVPDAVEAVEIRTYTGEKRVIEF